MQQIWVDFKIKGRLYCGYRIRNKIKRERRDIEGKNERKEVGSAEEI